MRAVAGNAQAALMTLGLQSLSKTVHDLKPEYSVHCFDPLTQSAQIV
jgi:hypothetical protein